MLLIPLTTVCFLTVRVAGGDIPPNPVLSHLVIVSESDVLSMRIQSPRDPSGRIAFDQQRFGDSKSFKLEAALRSHLDRDHNGNVTTAELATAESLLATLDVDEDESLAPLELASDLAVATETGTRLKNHVELVLINTAEDVENLKSILTRLGKTDSAPLEQPDFQLTISNGDRPSLTLVKTAGSDSILSRSEHSARYRLLKGLVDLDLWSDMTSVAQSGRPIAPQPVTEALAAPTLAVQVRPGRRGWFEWLDSNGDGKLSRIELRHATKELGRETDLDQRVANRNSYVVRIGKPGTLPRTFIPLLPPFGNTKAPSDDSLGWFKAMDSNGDGDVSRDEFLGGDPLFERIDSDGDGLMTATEAVKLVTSDKPKEQTR